MQGALARNVRKLPLDSRRFVGVFQLNGQAARLEQLVGDIGRQAGATGGVVEPGGGQIGVGLVAGRAATAEQVQLPADVEIGAIGVCRTGGDQRDLRLAGPQGERTLPRNQMGVGARAGRLQRALRIKGRQGRGPHRQGLAEPRLGALGVRRPFQSLFDKALQLRIVVERPPPRGAPVIAALGGVAWSGGRVIGRRQAGVRRTHRRPKRAGAEQRQNHEAETKKATHGTLECKH